MTTITVSSTVGITLASPAYVNPVAVDPGVTIETAGEAIYANSGPWIIQNGGTIVGSGHLGFGIYLYGAGTITNENSGLISGSYYAVRIGYSGDIINNGFISNTGTSGGGVWLSLGGSVTNATTNATISGFRSGINIESSGTVSNQGTIESTGSGGIGLYAGIFITTGNGTVINSGAISGLSGGLRGSGIQLSFGGVVTNASSASIAGGEFGILSGGSASIVNYGVIESSGTAFAGGRAVELNAGAVTNAGAGLINGSYDGVRIDVGVGTVINNGSITGTIHNGVYLGAGGSITNAASASISGGSGVDVSGTVGAVVNYGSIAATGTGKGVDLLFGGSITNAVTGTISAASANAIYIGGGIGTVVNAGQIIGGGTHVAINLSGGGSVINQAGGTISSPLSAGVFMTGASRGTVMNAGRIGGSPGRAIDFRAGGYIGNSANGTLTATNAVVAYVGGAAGTLINAGYMANSTGTHASVVFEAGGSLTNAASGTITAAEANAPGIVIQHGIGAVTNYGEISGGGTRTALDLNLGGSVTNHASGTIKSGAGGGDGIYTSGAAVTILNAGVITGAGGAPGVQLRAGGSVTNQSGGLITGGAHHSGIYVLGVAATITNYGVLGDGNSRGTNFAGTGGVVINAGTIVGSGVDYAMRFASGFTNLLIAKPGAVFSGIADGGNPIGATAVSTLELASGGGRGTLSGLGSHYVNFTQTTVDTSAYWFLTGTNSIASGATLTNLGTLDLASASLTDSGTLTNDGGIVLDPSTLSANDLTGAGGVTIDAGSTLDALGTVGSGQTMSFNGGYLHLYQPTSAAGSVVNFAAGDTIDLAGIDPASVTYASGALDFTGGSFPLDIVPGNTLHVAASADGTELTALCFCAGTMILTPSGERRVQELAVGDLVTTASGATRRIAWIGTGKVLATRGRRNAATPVIVRKNALAPNVPSRDLHLTKGHCLYLDAVLIPVEQLINHRSITWDDRAQQVELFHIELDTHDVLLADGTPAESYRDDGNRWLFRNANSGWHLPPQQPCAPLLTGGPIVDAIWRRLLDRAGPRPGLPLTDEPDLHLIVDGVRVDAASRDGAIVAFHLARRPKSVRIVSRAAAPDQLGLTRDPRELGVALRRITLKRGHRHTSIEAEDARLAAGFHPFEPADAIRWTNGDAVVPTALFADMNRPALLLLHLVCRTRYIADAPTDRAA